MPNKRNEIFRFGEFRLDVGEARLNFREEPVNLAPKAFGLLVVLLERAGTLVEKEELMEALWPDAVVEEANLTVNMSAVRKALSLQPDMQFIETVPKRGYRFVAEITQEQLDPPAVPGPEAKPADPAAATPRWQFRAIAATVAMLALIATAAFVFRRPAAPSSAGAGGPPSIAVMPFQSLSGSTEHDRWMGLGMTDALITRLSMARRFSVRSIQQMSQFDKPGVDPLAAARALRVDWLVTGGVQQGGGILRLSAQLVRAGDGKVIWAEKLDQRSANVFAAQDAISDKLAAHLLPHLEHGDGAASQVVAGMHTADPEAFRLYTQGRIEMQRMTGDSYRQARDLLEQSIAHDPGFALPYMSLGDVLVTSWFREPAHRRALELRIARNLQGLRKIDPELPELHLASGWAKQWIEWDWKGAELEYRQAIEHNPNLADAHASYGHLLEIIGRMPEALTEYQHSFRLNPVGEGHGVRLAVVLYENRQFSEALAVAKAVREESVSPTYQVSIAYISGLCLIRMGRREEVDAEIERINAARGQGRGGRLEAHLLAAVGRKKEALALLEAARSDGERGAYALALAQTALGNKDEAFRLLDLAVGRKDAFGLSLLGLDFAPLRTDERFPSLLVRLHLPSGQ
ncbi:MAG: winged helix-turn-helix domain-containing protein [Bryobacteraceae bacterium]|nr:winged helix-turn-helix domain-containing protein [Bryobacteraceae bacterium]